MAYVVTAACIDVKDRACTEECPVDCIYEGDRMLYINPDECVDCGKCMPACPNGAIASEYKLDGPQEVFLDIAQACPNGAIASEYKLDGPQEVFLDIAQAFFDEHPDASGGAEDAGPVGADHPEVAAWT